MTKYNKLLQDLVLKYKDGTSAVKSYWTPHNLKCVIYDCATETFYFRWHISKGLGVTPKPICVAGCEADESLKLFDVFASNKRGGVVSSNIEEIVICGDGDKNTILFELGIIGDNASKSYEYLKTHFARLHCISFYRGTVSSLFGDLQSCLTEVMGVSGKPDKEVVTIYPYLFELVKLRGVDAKIGWQGLVCYADLLHAYNKPIDYAFSWNEKTWMSIAFRRRSDLYSADAEGGMLERYFSNVIDLADRVERQTDLNNAKTKLLLADLEKSSVMLKLLCSYVDTIFKPYDTLLLQSSFSPFQWAVWGGFSCNDKVVSTLLGAWQSKSELWERQLTSYNETTLSLIEEAIGEGYFKTGYLSSKFLVKDGKGLRIADTIEVFKAQLFFIEFHLIYMLFMSLASSVVATREQLSDAVVSQKLKCLLNGYAEGRVHDLGKLEAPIYITKKHTEKLHNVLPTVFKDKVQPFLTSEKLGNFCTGGVEGRYPLAKNIMLLLDILKRFAR